MPIAEATMVAVQLQPDRDDVRIVSFGGATTGRAPLFGVTLAELRNGLSDATDPFEALRRRIEADSGTHWAAYVVGALAVLLHEGIGSFSVGLSLLVYSEVPEGKGVSSSAAIEVATMIALLATEGIELSPADRLPILCQRVEHKVVGAPCGVMDQMASALGLEGRLLSLLCRPAKLLEPVGIPTHLRFWGIDSGVRHFVGGSDYGTVRCATFMGRAMLRRALEGKQPLEFLTELTPDRLAELEHNLPEEISGAEFLRQHADHGDSATTIDPSIVYKVRLCTRHPVLEHHRVSEFERLLRQPASKEQLARLGELMYQSHFSYSAVGLGSDATDQLVQLVRDAGAASGLYGAKITGGGSGGTVCVLGESGASAKAAVRAILERYQSATNHTPYVVIGSSVGALEFGHLRIPPVQLVGPV